MQLSSRGAAVLGLVLAASAIVGGVVGPAVRATAANGTDLHDSVKSFTRVLSVVERNYADSVDVDRAIYDGAIPGMLQILDPHSIFFDPKQYASFREQQIGKYFGVGLSIISRDDHVIVLSPFPGSPASKAGVRPGDVIYAIDGKICEGITSSEASNLLRGAKGTPVHVAFSREGWEKPIEMDLIRDEIPRPGVDFFTMVRPGIGYARVSAFNDTTDSDFSEAIRQLDLPKLDGLIVD